MKPSRDVLELASLLRADLAGVLRAPSPRTLEAVNIVQVMLAQVSDVVSSTLAPARTDPETALLYEKFTRVFDAVEALLDESILSYEVQDEARVSVLRRTRPKDTGVPTLMHVFSFVDHPLVPLDLRCLLRGNRVLLSRQGTLHRAPAWVYTAVLEDPFAGAHCEDITGLGFLTAPEAVRETALALWDPHEEGSPFSSLGSALLAATELA